MITVKKDAIKIKTPDGMQSVGVLANVGTFGENWLEYATELYRTFRTVTFPENNGMEIYVKNCTTFYMAFDSTKNVKRIKIKSDSPHEVNMSFIFQYSDVELVDLSEFNCAITNMGSAFRSCANLKEIIGKLDMSKTTSFNATFTSDYKLEKIEFKENTIFVSISFAQSKLLSAESIKSIINGLATVETAQTLTFHAEVKAKLTDEQIATITSKNWTLA